MPEIVGQSPVYFAVFVPLAVLCKILPHEQQLFARMRVLEGVQGLERGKLVFNPTGSLAEHRLFEMHDLVVTKDKHVIFGEGVIRRVRELAMLPVAVYRVLFQVLQSIVHPAHVPFEEKAQAALVRCLRDSGKNGGILGDEIRAGLPGDSQIELPEKFRALKIFAAAVFVRTPLSAPEARVQHCRHGVYAQRVYVKFPYPVECVGYEEAPDLALAVVKGLCAPLRVFGQQRVGGFVQRGAVKAFKAEAVLRKMRRDPVQNDADTVDMHGVNKIAEVVRTAIAAGGGVVAGHLIAP